MLSNQVLVGIISLSGAEIEQYVNFDFLCQKSVFYVMSFWSWGCWR